MKLTKKIADVVETATVSVAINNARQKINSEMQLPI